MRPEAPSRMEPLGLDEISPVLSDTAAQVVRLAERVGGNLAPATLLSLADQVRIMNCYYSNLIEGHPTRPRDIDAALRPGDAHDAGPAVGDPKRRNLLLLALAHINTQHWIDRLHAEGVLPDPASVHFITEVHRRFYADLPGTFLEIRRSEDGPPGRVMVPGMPRAAGEEVAVGLHQAPSGGAVLIAFLDRFASHYAGLRRLGPVQRLCGIAASHHRLLFIHPFDDGNGRVARLVTHAMMLDAGLGAHGLWSMARGMARGVRADAPFQPAFLGQFAAAAAPDQYKLMMAHADMARMGDLDGRGNLSRRRLHEFCEWFMAVALDQLVFMNGHFRLDAMVRRLGEQYGPRRGLRPDAAKVLEQTARLGEIPRSAVRAILGVSIRTATTIINELLADGILHSPGPRGPLRLRFDTDSSEILFPGLFGIEASLID